MSVVNFDWDEMDVINTLKIREATERAIKTDSNGNKRVVLSFDIEHIFDARAKAREEAVEEWRLSQVTIAEYRENPLIITEPDTEKSCGDCCEAYPLTFWQRLNIWLRNLRNF